MGFLSDYIYSATYHPNDIDYNKQLARKYYKYNESQLLNKLSDDFRNEELMQFIYKRWKNHWEREAIKRLERETHPYIKRQVEFLLNTGDFYEAANYMSLDDYDD